MVFSWTGQLPEMQTEDTVLPVQHSSFDFSAWQEYVRHISAVNNIKPMASLCSFSCQTPPNVLDGNCLHNMLCTCPMTAARGNQQKKMQGGRRKKTNTQAGLLCLRQTHVYWWVQSAKQDTTAYDNHQGLHVIPIVVQTCYQFLSHHPKGTRNPSFLAPGGPCKRWTRWRLHHKWTGRESLFLLPVLANHPS